MNHIGSVGRSFRIASVFIVLAAGVAGAGYPASSPAAEKGADMSQEVGVGLGWQPLELANSFTAANTGYVSVRTWLNDKIGVDAGLGMGLRQVSGPTSFLLNMSLTPMYAIERWHTSVLYVDGQLIPAIATGGGTSFLFSTSAGVGVESALPGLDNVRWYAQLNPVSIDYFSPGGGGDSKVELDFLGSNMPVSFGLHYYFK